MTQLFLAAQAAQGGGSMTSFFIMMIAIFAIMYFFMIRPQQKRQKEIQNFQNTLAEGTPVVTGGGIYGTVLKGGGKAYPRPLPKRRGIERRKGGG